jgi:hypothetical protein
MAAIVQIEDVVDDYQSSPKRNPSKGEYETGPPLFSLTYVVAISVLRQRGGPCLTLFPPVPAQDALTREHRVMMHPTS